MHSASIQAASLFPKHNFAANPLDRALITLASPGGQSANAGMLPPSDSDEEEEEKAAPKPKGQVRCLMLCGLQ